MVWDIMRSTFHYYSIHLWNRLRKNNIRIERKRRKIYNHRTVSHSSDDTKYRLKPIYILIIIICCNVFGYLLRVNFIQGKLQTSQLASTFGHVAYASHTDWKTNQFNCDQFLEFFLIIVINFQIYRHHFRIIDISTNNSLDRFERDMPDSIDGFFLLQVG